MGGNHILCYRIKSHLKKVWKSFLFWNVRHSLFVSFIPFFIVFIILYSITYFITKTITPFNTFLFLIFISISFILVVKLGKYISNKITSFLKIQIRKKRIRPMKGVNLRNKKFISKSVSFSYQLWLTISVMVIIFYLPSNLFPSTLSPLELLARFSTILFLRSKLFSYLSLGALPILFLSSISKVYYFPPVEDPLSLILHQFSQIEKRVSKRILEKASWVLRCFLSWKIEKFPLVKKSEIIEKILPILIGLQSNRIKLRKASLNALKDLKKIDERGNSSKLAKYLMKFPKNSSPLLPYSKMVKELKIQAKPLRSIGALHLTHIIPFLSLGVAIFSLMLKIYNIFLL